MKGDTCRSWRRRDMNCGSGRPIGTNIECSKGLIRISASMFSRRGVRKSSECCCSGTGGGATQPIADSTKEPSWDWLAKSESMCRITPTRRPAWSKGSLRGRMPTAQPFEAAIAGGLLPGNGAVSATADGLISVIIPLDATLCFRLRGSLAQERMGELSAK